MLFICSLANDEVHSYCCAIITRDVQAPLSASDFMLNSVERIRLSKHPLNRKFDTLHKTRQVASSANIHVVKAFGNAIRAYFDKSFPEDGRFTFSNILEAAARVTPTRRSGSEVHVRHVKTGNEIPFGIPAPFRKTLSKNSPETHVYSYKKHFIPTSPVSL